MLAAAQEAGKIGSRHPKDAQPHLEEVRQALWWSARFGVKGELSTEREIRSEIAAADQAMGDYPAAADQLQASNHALRWVLGEVDSPHLS